MKGRKGICEGGVSEGGEGRGGVREQVRIQTWKEVVQRE